MTKIIGLAGKRRVGKDTVADYLGTIGFTRAAFADKVREALLALDPWIVSSNGYLQAPERLSYLIENLSWEEIKNSEWAPSVREYMQRMGTEVGRNVIDSYVWIDLLASSYLWVEPGLVISDVRFANEAKFIHSENGIVIHLSRETGLKDSHSSENIGFPCDYYVDNNGTIQELQNKVHGILSSEGLF